MHYLCTHTCMQVINIQMEGNDFFDHLLSLGEVRKRLDGAYRKVPQLVRGDIEALWAPSLWLLPGSREEYDPEQRQFALYTTRVVARTEGDKIKSGYLRRLDGELVSLLGRLEAVFASSGSSAADDVELEPAQMKERVLEGMVDGAVDDSSVPCKVAVRLAMLIQKRRQAVLLKLADLKGDPKNKSKVSSLVKEGLERVNAGSLWRDIVSCTDEIYVVHEHMAPVFEQV